MNPPSRQRLWRFSGVYVGLGTALGILTAVILVGRSTTNQLADSVRLQDHAYTMLLHMESASSDMRGMEAAHRGFVAVGDSHFIAEYAIARDSMLSSLEAVHQQTTDETVRGLAQRLQTQIAQRLAYMDRTRELARLGRNEEAQAEIRVGSESRLRSEVYEGFGKIAARERQIIQHRTAAVAQGMRTSRGVNAAGVATSTVLVFLSILLFRSEAARRRRAKALLESSEERLRDFLDSASDLIQSSGPDGRLIYVNRALLEALGYEEQEVIGLPSEMFFAPECVAQGHALFERILGGESVTDIETVYIRNDGRRIHVKGSSNCRFEDGKPVASRTILHDVTQQREVERMKDQFVSIVSHELRTPLTSIRGALGLLSGGLLGDVSDRGKRMLELAVTNTDRLIRLINDILDVERIESGALPMARHRVALAEIMRHVEEMMRPLALKAGINLLITANDVDLNADEDRIVQMLTNLVGNAIKFSPPGTAVHVIAELEADCIHICVRDEGRGIPAHMLETVFARFRQVDGSDIREKGGTGLGLAISKSIVEQHNGTIWVESKTGLGSAFHVRLPVMTDSVAVKLAMSPASNPDGTLIMVCDDDADVRTVLSAILTDRGFRVSVAESGESALKLAADERPSLILLDLLDTDGFAVVDWLRKHNRLRDVPIMVYSAKDVDDEQRERLGLRQELIFTKSRMAPEQLVERVAAVVARNMDKPEDK
ncbi:MAG: ATP-binding protein [Longimicrobiales bacterium]